MRPDVRSVSNVADEGRVLTWRLQLQLIASEFLVQPMKSRISTSSRPFIIPGRRLVVLGALLLLALFWDSLLPIMGHLLHLLIEVVELPLEHLLEWAFHVSPRQAQGILAWTAAAGLLYGGAKLVRMVYIELLTTWNRLRAAIESFKVQYPMLFDSPARTITVTIGLIGTLAYMIF